MKPTRFESIKSQFPAAFTEAALETPLQLGAWPRLESCSYTIRNVKGEKRLYVKDKFGFSWAWDFAQAEWRHRMGC